MISNDASLMMQEPNTETIDVESLDDFVHMLVSWHGHKHAILTHMLEMPDGTYMQMGENEPVAMTGDMLAGFKVGIQLALMELGTLPFQYSTETSD